MCNSNRGAGAGRNLAPPQAADSHGSRASVLSLDVEPVDMCGVESQKRMVDFALAAYLGEAKARREAAEGGAGGS